MKKILYIILLTLSLGSCGSRGKCFLSPELEEVRILMSNNPQEALQKLQSMPNSMSYCDSASLCLYDLEYSVLLAEALYKNYFPQSNFDDIKAFVDRIDSEKTPNSTLIIPDYLRAKAHYYYAVGLSERDNIVDACEHYLKALEVLSEIKKPDYEQTRFIALTYNRLGDLFQNCGYSDLSLQKYKKALTFIEMINDTLAQANIFKVIGNTYYLLNNQDSALYYYNLTLKTTSHDGVRFDIEKPMAYILYEKGHRDSACQMLKDNISQIQDFNLLCSYYNALGELYFLNNEYDKAIACFDTAFMSSHDVIKTMAAKMLSSIYDTIGDDVQKRYYSDFVLEYSVNKVNKSLETAKIQNVYDDYCMRKDESDYKMLKSYSSVAFIIVIIIVVVLVMYHVKSRKNLEDAINEKERVISDTILKNEKLEKNLTSAKIKLKSKEEELLKLRDRKEPITSDSLTSFCNTEICKYILDKIKDAEGKGYKPTTLEMLSKTELMMLLRYADEHLDNLITNLSKDYPNFDDIDKLCICLSILKIDKMKIARLLNKNYKTIWRRFEKIKTVVDKDDNKYGLTV